MHAWMKSTRKYAYINEHMEIVAPSPSNDIHTYIHTYNIHTYIHHTNIHTSYIHTYYIHTHQRGEA